jgi:hypothetical protein
MFIRRTKWKKLADELLDSARRADEHELERVRWLVETFSRPSSAREDTEPNRPSGHQGLPNGLRDVWP